MSQTDDTGFEATAAAVDKILRPKVENRMEREHVRTTIESPGWRIFFERALLPTLADWREDLLNRVDLTEAERQGTVRARLALIDAISLMYQRVYGEAAVERMPSWLKQELL